MENFKHAGDEPKHVNTSGIISATVPSFAAASELLSAPYSCLVMNTHRRHIALPPKYLQKKRTGIQEELEGELLRFSESLKGVPLAYDNIRIVRQQGDIYDDSGYIHMDVEANFVIFKPNKGQHLVGKVNKLAVSHVGCLVHGCFNASIPKPNLVTMETWRDAGPRIGTELEFEVTALDADAVGVLLIRGRMDQTRVQELLAMGESAESSVPADQLPPPDTEPNPDPIQEPPEDTPTKKKKKKDKVKEERAEEEVDGNATQEVNGSEVVKKKKKKKDKVKEERVEDEVDGKVVNGSTDEMNGIEVVVKKKKKKDKVKEERVEDEVAGKEVNGSTDEMNGNEVVVKKKKKKDKVKEERVEDEVAGNATQELNGSEVIEKKKKKKKKKHLKEEAEEVTVSPVEVHGSDSSGYLSDKPSKKRKRGATADANSDHATPKSKKKRKGDVEQFA